MTLYNEILYNSLAYNGLGENDSIFKKAETGIDFGNGFKVPNNISTSCMIGYLDPMDSKYSTTRVTQIQQNFTNIQNTGGGIEFIGQVRGNNRKELTENIELFKKMIEGKRNIVFKDAGVERGVIAYCKVKFEENHYNITYIDYKIVCTYLDYIFYDKSISLNYPGKTGAIENFNFYNSGQETHYIFMLNYTVANNLDVTITLNGVDLVINGINAGDNIIVDTLNISVKKNGVELVFGGIISKLIPGDNNINITDNGSARNFDFKTVYKNTIR